MRTVLFYLFFKHFFMSTTIYHLKHLFLFQTSLSQTSFYFKHISISNIFHLENLPISNISLFRTSLYFNYFKHLEHLPISSISLSRNISISNISLTATSLYIKHPSISKIPLSRKSLYRGNLSIPNISSIFPSISLTQASLYLKHLSITNYFIFRLFSSISRLRLLGQCCVNYYFLHYYSSQRLTACQLSESGQMFNLSWIMNNQNLFL